MIKFYLFKYKNFKNNENMKVKIINKNEFMDMITTSFD